MGAVHVFQPLLVMPVYIKFIPCTHFCCLCTFLAFHITFAISTFTVLGICDLLFLLKYSISVEILQCIAM